MYSHDFDKQPFLIWNRGRECFPFFGSLSDGRQDVVRVPVFFSSCLSHCQSLSCGAACEFTKSCAAVLYFKLQVLEEMGNVEVGENRGTCGGVDSVPGRTMERTIKKGKNVEYQHDKVVRHCPKPIEVICHHRLQVAKPPCCHKLPPGPKKIKCLGI